MKKILIVEDHAEARYMLAQTLVRAGLTVLEAETGTRALMMARTYKPEVMLLDIVLPGNLNGFQICEKVRTDPGTADTFVILTSGLNDEGSFKRAKEAGAQAYLVKPFKLSRLLDIVSGYSKLAGTFTLDRGI